MRKKDRQRLIQQLILENKVSKQEELVKLLLERNIPVTQATISRDMKEMRLTKTSFEGEELSYAMPDEQVLAESKLEKLLATSFKQVKLMDKFVSLEASPGSGVALGQLIELVFDDVLFSVISNDAKVLMVAYTEQLAMHVEKQIREMATMR